MTASEFFHNLVVRILSALVSCFVFVAVSLFIHYNQVWLYEQGLLHAVIWLSILWIVSGIITFILMCIFVRGIQAGASDTGGRRT